MEFLKSQQLPHFNRLLEIMAESPFACDFSVMGAGKTWTSTCLAKIYDIPMIVIGPKSSLAGWKSVCQQVGVKTPLITNYESLRSIKNCQPIHGYLKRFDYSSGNIRIGFAATDKLKSLLRQTDILLVVDEFQMIKNNNGQYLAVRAMIEEITRISPCSRVLFLSASPFEEAKHALNFYHLVGFCDELSLGKEESIIASVTRIIDSLHQQGYESEELERLVIQSTPFNKKNVLSFIFETFAHILAPRISSSMPQPCIEFERNVGNGFYQLQSEEEIATLTKAINHFKSITFYDKEEGTIKVNTMGVINNAMMKVETAKIPIFEREATRILETSKGSKVVIFVNYRQSVDTLAALLACYNPLVFDGRTKAVDESKIITAFQEDNTCRLLIANLRKGCISISLHDTRGDSPRFALASPTYSILDIHQASGRLHRQGLKTNSTFRLVFGYIPDDHLLECKILNALARKTCNMKQILTQQVEEGIIFPGDYPNVYY